MKKYLRLFFLLGVGLAFVSQLGLAQVHPGSSSFTTAQSISKSWGDDSRVPDVEYIYYSSTHYAYAVWIEGGIPGAAFFSRSADGGATWSTPVNLSVGYAAYNVTLSARSNKVYIAMEWQDPGDIWFISSTDNGATWDTDNDWLNVVSNSGDSEYPDIECSGPSGSEIYIAWHDNSPFGNYTVFAKHGDGNGYGTWDPAKRMTWTSTHALYPRIAMGSTSASPSSYAAVHVVWHDFTGGSNADIYYNYSHDFASTWSGVKRLTFSASSTIYPEISAQVGDEYVHIVWTDYLAGNWDVFYKRLSGHGTTIPNGVTKRLTFSPTHSLRPNISATTIPATGNAWVAVVWYDKMGAESDTEVVFKEDYWSGSYWINAWGSTKRLTFNTGNSQKPAIAYYPGNTGGYTGVEGAHVLWTDFTVASGKAEIYHRFGY